MLSMTEGKFFAIHRPAGGYPSGIKEEVDEADATLRPQDNEAPPLQEVKMETNTPQIPHSAPMTPGFVSGVNIKQSLVRSLFHFLFNSKISFLSANNIQTHPKFLHSNSTSHVWAFGAIAELIGILIRKINQKTMQQIPT